MDPKAAAADSIGETTKISSRPSNSLSRDIFIVLIASWVARVAFICLVPAGARSLDSYCWEFQAGYMNSGLNPYQVGHPFNWPPLWMQCVFLMAKIAGFLGVPFFLVLQFFLILVESAVIIQVMRLIRQIAPAANARAIALIGIALNPAAILLICQECNFDVLMLLWVLLAVESLLRYNASGDFIDWLCACMFLGLGILTKTVPLALVPLLAGGFRRATASGRFLATTLVLGPTALGMSIIYVLAPSAVLHNVLEYRAQGIYFGFPGFLHAMGMDSFSGWFDGAFYILGIGIMALTWRHLWKHHSLSDRETVLYIALLLLVIPEFGPGCGNEYFYWFLPFLVISYAAFGGLWRKLLIGYALINVITLIIEFGLMGTYGFNFLFILTHAPTADVIYHDWKASPAGPIATAVRWATWFSSPVHDTMERIPLFIAMLAIIVFGAGILAPRLQEDRKWVIRLAGIYTICVAVIFAAAIGTKCLWPGNPLAGNSNSNQSAQGAARN